MPAPSSESPGSDSPRSDSPGFESPGSGSHRPESVVNATGADIRRDGDGWCVTVTVDGKRRVVSRHASEASAHDAVRHLNWSANRQPGDHRG